ncbi:hypothetical protein [Peribacillus sp. V2I11]|uniref:hypothetical protein n=1 Tax=Peribacillus sp. V2I11 TaxID=3042277 RepID=UPI0027871039|nr:hypothetical protein [Peribacillus sp. V2I11]MDQ0881383.1 hypothetical protein [Peribacillus sp. V2I11]
MYLEQILVKIWALLVNFTFLLVSLEQILVNFMLLLVNLEQILVSLTKWYGANRGHAMLFVVDTSRPYTKGKPRY